jgi:hypothetical protein
MEIAGLQGRPPEAWKENSRILSKLGELGKRAFKAPGAWKESGRILSKLGELGKEAFKALGALKENGQKLSKFLFRARQSSSRWDGIQSADRPSGGGLHA